jgi:hypothetical protein
MIAVRAGAFRLPAAPDSDVVMSATIKPLADNAGKLSTGFQRCFRRVVPRLSTTSSTSVDMELRVVLPPVDGPRSRTPICATLPQ